MTNKPTTETENRKSDYLPPWTYQSDSFLQLEIDYLFKRNWLLAGHISDVSKPGDYLTFDAFDEQVLVIRDRAGELNAFFNLCQHRGGRILDQSTGHCKGAMTCPFHGWSYDLNGKLLNVPRADTFKASDITSVSLRPVDMEIWMGFIFIRLQAGCQSVAEQLAPIADEVLNYQPELMEPYLPASEELKPFNWKCIHDIDNEGYHVPIGHPALHELYGETYKDTIENEIMVARGTISDRIARSWSVRHYQKLLPAFDHLPAQRQRIWFYFNFYPNLIFGFYPDMMEIYMTIPESIDTTRYISRTYALPDKRPETRASRYLNVRINTETADEDDAFVAALQKGMLSTAWQPPRLSTLEEGVRFFHHRIQRDLPVGQLEKPPFETEIPNINNKLLNS